MLSKIVAASLATLAGHGLEIIGHRGAPDLYPESSSHGYHHASHHANVLECDVNFSKGGVPVCWHDNFLSKTMVSELQFELLRNHWAEQSGNAHEPMHSSSITDELLLTQIPFYTLKSIDIMSRYLNRRDSNFVGNIMSLRSFLKQVEDSGKCKDVMLEPKKSYWYLRTMGIDPVIESVKTVCTHGLSAFCTMQYIARWHAEELLRKYKTHFQVPEEVFELASSRWDVSNYVWVEFSPGSPHKVFFESHSLVDLTLLQMIGWHRHTGLLAILHSETGPLDSPTIYIDSMSAPGEIEANCQNIHNMLPGVNVAVDKNWLLMHGAQLDAGQAFMEVCKRLGMKVYAYTLSSHPSDYNVLTKEPENKIAKHIAYDMFVELELLLLLGVESVFSDNPALTSRQYNRIEALNALQPLHSKITALTGALRGYAWQRLQSSRTDETTM